MSKFDVTIAGELNLDLILYGLPESLLPERELLAENMMLTLGSSSAIVAHNLAALGSRVGFVSCIGGDSFGDIALQRLSASGVHVEQVIRNPSAQTGLTVILQHGNWRNILTYPGTIFDLKPEHLNFQYLSSSRHFHFSSFYLQRGLRPHVKDIFRQLKHMGSLFLSIPMMTRTMNGNRISKKLCNMWIFSYRTREKQRRLLALRTSRTQFPNWPQWCRSLW